MSAWSRPTRFAAIIAAGLFLFGADASMAETTPQDEQSSEDIQRKLDEITNEIQKFTEELKISNDILSFFKIVTKNYSEYQSRWGVYINSCSARKAEYEQMKRENSIFRDRYLPAVQRCRDERATLDRALREMGDTIAKIEADVGMIRRNLDKLSSEIDRGENEKSLYESLGRVKSNTKKLDKNISDYKAPGS